MSEHNRRKTANTRIRWRRTVGSPPLIVCPGSALTWKRFNALSFPPPRRLTVYGRIQPFSSFLFERLWVFPSTPPIEPSKFEQSLPLPSLAVRGSPHRTTPYHGPPIPHPTVESHGVGGRAASATAYLECPRPRGQQHKVTEST